MSMMRNTKAPLRILICALGGEGGGVLVCRCINRLK